MIGRRSFLRGALLSVPAGAVSLTRAAAAGTPEAVNDLPVHVATDRVPEGVSVRLQEATRMYMRAMHAPGMTFTLTSLAGEELTAAYGWSNLDLHTPMLPDLLFQIGSISKSMAAVLVLQLVDEGKLDLGRPVGEYLPWLPWHTPFGAVTLHHVLTHTSGMPGDGALSFVGGTWIHEQRYAPGKHYFYSNMAFNTLGHLVEMCDGGSYQESLRTRLLLPLGMVRTLPQIGAVSWKEQPTSYVPADPDRPYLRFSPLRPAAVFHEQTSAGCVVSTASEMAMYLRFLLRCGVLESGKRLLSADSFGRMTTPWIGAEEFGKTASYGYGIAVDRQDGEKVLLHTGGMVSFMSAMYLNLDRGIGAFASINAQQGYRPRSVVRHAVLALRAARLNTAAPPVPVVADARVVADADAFAGVYASGAETVRLIAVDAADGRGLVLQRGGATGAVECEEDTLNVDDELLGREAWKIVRDAKRTVIGLAHGSAFYRREGAPPLPAMSAAPKAWQAYVGHYANDDPWVGSTAIFEREGKLYMDTLPLTPRDDGSFFVEGEADSADRLAFAAEISGKAQVLLLNGTPMRRFRPWPTESEL